MAAAAELRRLPTVGCVHRLFAAWVDMAGGISDRCLLLRVAASGARQRVRLRYSLDSMCQA